MSEIDKMIQDEIVRLEYNLTRFLENYDDEHNKAIELGALTRANEVIEASTALLRHKGEK